MAQDSDFWGEVQTASVAVRPQGGVRNQPQPKPQVQDKPRDFWGEVGSAAQTLEKTPESVGASAAFGRKGSGDERTAGSYVTGVSDYQDIKFIRKITRITGELAETRAIADPEDAKWFKRVMDFRTAPKTIGFKATSILLDMIPFVQDIFLGKAAVKGGLKIAGKVAIEKAVETWAKRSLARELVAQGMKGAASIVTAEVMKEAAGLAGAPSTSTTRVAFEEDMYQQRFRLTEDEAGDLRAAILTTQPDAVKALVRAGLGTLIEGATEMMGGSLAKLPIASRLAAFQHAAVQRVLGKGGTISKAIQKVADGTAYDGLLQEVLEERGGDVLRALLGPQGIGAALPDGETLSKGTWADIIPEADDFAAELLALGAPGVGGVVASRALGSAPAPADQVQGEVVTVPKGGLDTSIDGAAAPDGHPVEVPVDTTDGAAQPVTEPQEIPGGPGTEGQVPPEGPQGVPVQEIPESGAAAGAEDVSSGGSLGVGATEGSGGPRGAASLEDGQAAPVEPQEAPAAEDAFDPAPLAALEGQAPESYSEVPEPDISPEQRLAVSRGRESGLRVRIVKGMKAAGAFLKPGELIVSADAPVARVVARHEQAHDLVAKSGGTDSGAWRQTYRDIRRADPTGMRKAQEKHRLDWLAGAGLKDDAEGRAVYRERHPKGIATEEAFATYAAEVTAYAEMLRSADGRRHLQRLARRDPGFFRRVMNWIRDTWERATGRDDFEAAALKLGVKFAEGPRRESAVGAIMLQEAFEVAAGRPAARGTGGGARFAAAWHGTGAQFDEFEDEAIGTGEGAQAYGYGHYFASRREVGKSYKDQQTHRDVKRAFLDALPEDAEFGEVMDLIGTGTFTPKQEAVLKALDASDWLGFDYPSQAISAALRSLDRFDPDPDLQAAVDDLGVLLKVDLAPKAEDYLLWDRPLSEQSEKVRAALEKVQESLPGGAQSELLKGNPTGEDIRNRLWGEFDAPANRGQQDRMASATLLAAGIRGIKYLDEASRSKGEGSFNYVVFDPADVKIEARFAPGEPSTLHERYNLLDPEAWEAAQQAPMGKWDKFRRAIQDLALPIQRLEEAIDKAGGSTAHSPRRAIANMPGKIQARDRELTRAWKRIQKIARRNKHWGLGYDGAIQAIGNVLYARHVPERNAYLFQEKGVEDGSGWSDEKARQVLAENEGRAGMAEIEALVRSEVIEKTRDQMDGTGLVRPDSWDGDTLVAGTVSTWRSLFPNYVPLRSAETDVEGPSYVGPRGGGWQVTGAVVHSMEGRASEADNPLAMAFAQAQSMNMAAEKARVGREMWDLLRDDANVGQVSYTELDPPPDPKEWDPKNAFGLWVDGERRTLRLDNEDVNRAMKGLGYSPVHPVLRLHRSLLFFMSRMVTGWNPNFMIPNWSRDLQTALVNITAEKQSGIRRRALANIFPAMRAIAADSWLERAAPTEMGKFYTEVFVPEGGLIGWAKDVTYEDKMRDMTRDMKRGALKRTLFGMVGQIENINSVIEMSTRVAFAKALVDAGVAPADAIRSSRELTVDFNRRGEMTSQLSAYKMFINARIQGTAQMLINVKRNPRIAGIGAGIFAFGFGTSMLNILAMGSDDDDTPRYLKKAHWERERNIMLPNPWSDDPDEMFKIPLTYGYNIFYVLGDSAAEAAYRVNELGEDKGKVASEVAGRAARVIWDGFSPISDGTWIQAISPTGIVPLVQIQENVNWNGAPVLPEGNPFDIAPPPDSENYWNSASPAAIHTARTLNEWFGGNKFRSGTWMGLDMSVSPETLEHVYDSYLGGLAKIGENGYKLATKPWKDTGWNRVPVIRRFYSDDSSGFADRSAYYEAREEVVRSYRELKNLGAEAPYWAKKWAVLEPMSKRTDKALRKLRKLERATENLEEKRAAQESMDALYLSFMQQVNAIRRGSKRDGGSQ